jgi:phage terminase Nu1 subunit (DNA packaging protein)
MAAVGVEQIAKALNLTAQRVHQLKKLGLPHGARGEYELGPCMLWYIRYLQKAIEARSSGADGNITSLMSERTKQAREQAERTQMINLKARGEVLLADDVRQQVLKAVAYLAQDLVSVAQRVTTDETLQAKVEDEIRLARNRFSEHLATLASPGPRVARRRGGHAGARPKNAGRVGRRVSSAAAGDTGAGTVAQ